MCRVLGVSFQGYYHWRSRGRSLREQSDSHLLLKIRSIYRTHKGRYGAPRVHAELKRTGTKVSLKRVSRLMREQQLQAVTKRKFKATTNSKHTKRIARNLLRRNFYAEQRNKVWVTDATYIATSDGWLYLCVFIDLHSRAVVGWQVSKRLTSSLFTAAFEVALLRRSPPEGLIVHSDSGVQYASEAFRKLLRASGARQSMSRKGDCWDNSPAESFFSTIKRELVYQNSFESRASASRAIASYIDQYYNYQRSHSYVGYSTPMGFELAA